MKLSFCAHLHQELSLSWRNKSSVLLQCTFLVLASFLFPLGLSDLSTLETLAVPILYVLALMAFSNSFPQIFQKDFEDGTLTQLYLHPVSIHRIALIKALALWISHGLILVAIAPFLAMLLKIPMDLLPLIILSLSLSLLAAALIGTLAASLTLGSKNKFFLTSVLVFPLFVPLIIFGTHAPLSETWSPFLMLLGLFLLYLPISIWLSGFALREALTQ
ncbi:MAG: heme exporter protein CcmB [Alphaproteobacteria bacterium]|jgi:heme exporter protein B|nr:heme exporter protein CcmB [Alphaproteobacteria bacterium]MBT5389340.1 heme exporter protein CcmB [Alphaproteobacteria bacterium]MBT5540408.1 heme exporter protein CcmB [Alphaproteobacteria bacterium]MBT5654645.1 heme exporter protein CcmB [Alphaproteobacteria bacterium]